MATRPASAARRTAAKRVKFLLNTFLVVCAESSTALSMLFIGMYPSSEFEFGSDVAFGLLQAHQSSDRLPPVWLHDHKTRRSVRRASSRGDAILLLRCVGTVRCLLDRRRSRARLR